MFGRNLARSLMGMLLGGMGASPAPGSYWAKPSDFEPKEKPPLYPKTKKRKKIVRLTLCDSRRAHRICKRYRKQMFYGNNPVEFALLRRKTALAGW